MSGYAGIKRKLRKGTHSCYECRRRKIRCIFPDEHPNVCKECFDRQSVCVGQEFVTQDEVKSSVPSKRDLEKRVGQLEALLECLLADSVTAQRISQLQLEKLGPGMASLSAPAISPCTPSSSQSSPPPSNYPHSEPGGDHESAPLMSLLSRFGISRSSPTAETGGLPQNGAFQHTPGTEIDQAHKDEYVAQRVMEAMPSKDGMDTIFKHRSKWWLLSRNSLGMHLGEDGDETLEMFAKRALKSRDPPLLGFLLVCFALSERNPAKYLPTVERWVVNDDAYAARIEGLHCLCALGKCYLEIAQPGRAWLVFRRGISLAMLRGIHHNYRSSKKLEAIWWQLVGGDRYLSLLMGLPCTAVHLDVPKKCPKDMPINEFYRQQFAYFGGEVINCLQPGPGGITEASLPSILDLDQRIDAICKEAPEDWWSISAAKCNSDTSKALSQLLCQLTFNQLRCYLHLPFWLRDPSNPRFTYSRDVCSKSSRDILASFLGVYERHPDTLSDFKLLSFVGLTAAVILMLGTFGYGFSEDERRLRAVLDQESFQTIRAVMAAFKERYDTENDLLCHQCHLALHTFLQARDTKDMDKVQNIVIPFFGTITVARRCCEPAARQQPQPTPMNSTTTAEMPEPPSMEMQSDNNQAVNAPQLTFEPHLAQSIPSLWGNSTTSVSYHGSHGFDGTAVPEAAFSGDIGFDLWGSATMDLDKDWNWLLGESQPQVFDVGAADWNASTMHNNG